MLISYNWLKKHVNIHNTFSAEEIGAKLKAATVEVERVDYQGKDLDKVVVGKVLSADKHPNADKLKVCKVDVGGEQLQIVCGGSNVREGMLVAVGKVGAKVKWHGEGDLVELKPTAIRGVESAGMICASTEIGLGEMFPPKEEKEILDLTLYNFVPGAALADALGFDDYILEIDNKTLSHRPDLWGHYGMAREVATLFNRDLNVYKVADIKENKELKLEVKIEDEKLCPRYMAVAVNGVKVGESPEWLKKSLLAVGMRPINNIVDITNYVMLDLGQPMHAFDAAKVAKNKIIVRRAKDGEEFVTLEGEKQKLDSNTLVIADAEKPIALAGVKGGLDSGITDNTNTIIFESANFDPTLVRKTSNKFNLRTDSAIRFEKSLDPTMCESALRKAVEMTLELCPEAKVMSKIVDKKHFALQTGPIAMDWEVFSRKLGIQIEQKEILHILEKLGFQFRTKKNSLSAKIPTWRATKDISIAEDVVEEVVRIYGFDNIPATLPVFPIIPPEENKLRKFERKIKAILAEGLKYTEVYNYSFVSESQVKKLGDDLSKYIELDNPLSKEKPYLRRNLLPNMLENVMENIERYPEIKIFEVGKVYKTEETGLRAKSNSDELLPEQNTWVTLMYSQKGNDNPYWEARRAIEAVFNSLHVDWEVTVLDKIMSWEHPSRVSMFSVGGVEVGVLHELHPATIENYGLPARVGVARIDLDKLVQALEKAPPRVSYIPVAVYPEVSRDLAFVVDRKTTHAAILEILKKSDTKVKNVELFDVYEGKGIADGYKSMAYHLTYADPERTLTTDEVDKAVEKVLKTLEKEVKAEIRK